MRAVSLRARLVAAVLLVQLTVLLAVMAALVVNLRIESRGRRTSERLVEAWAGRADPETLDRFCADADFIEEAAVLDANNSFTVGKRARNRTPEEMRAFQAEVSEMAARARARAERSKPPRWLPLREESRLLIPVVWEGQYREARFLRFEDPVASVGFGSLRTVYVMLLLGAAVSMAVTLLALRRWVLAPLAELARGAERVARGDFATPLPVRAGPGDEIEEAARAFNGMMAELGAFRKDLEQRVGDAVRKAREAEQNLVTAQRLAAVGTLAAGIAHDINNPLGGLVNAVRALRREDLAPEKRREYLALVEEGLDRMGHTVQKVLQFTPHRVAPQPCDLAEVAGRALALAQHRIQGSGVQVTVETPQEGLPVFGDPYELQQVVLNLLMNAADAIKERGRGSGRITVSGAAGEGEVRLLVEDDGVGMTEEQVARAFDLFYTTKEVGEGTGLGLAMVHTILESHGGRVEIRSRKGAGTTVEIALPRHRGGR